MRDVEVREIAVKELHICRECANRFTKEELLKSMETRGWVYEINKKD